MAPTSATQCVKLFTDEPHAVPHLAVMTASSAVETIRSVAVVERRAAQADGSLSVVGALSADSGARRAAVVRPAHCRVRRLVDARVRSVDVDRVPHARQRNAWSRSCRSSAGRPTRRSIVCARAFRAHDIADVRNVTHVVRGAASAFSAAPLTRALEITSTTAQRADWSNERVITALDNEWRRLREALLVSV
jgi:hypothetical protein